MLMNALWIATTVLLMPSALTHLVVSLANARRDIEEMEKLALVSDHSHSFQILKYYLHTHRY